jgi:hypothetical protein
MALCGVCVGVGGTHSALQVLLPSHCLADRVHVQPVQCSLVDNAHCCFSANRGRGIMTGAGVPAHVHHRCEEHPLRTGQGCDPCTTVMYSNVDQGLYVCMVVCQG